MTAFLWLRVDIGTLYILTAIVSGRSRAHPDRESRSPNNPASISDSEWYIQLKFSEIKFESSHFFSKFSFGDNFINYIKHFCTTICLGNV